MPTIFFLLLTFTAHLIASTQSHHNRRILHQPFFPFYSLPPTSQPPSSSPRPQQPKYPFSFQSPPNKQPSFFPSYPSASLPPPPPSTTSLPTFPANISSLILPQSSSSKHVSRKLIAIAVAAFLFSIALIAALVALLLYQGRHRSFIDNKALRSDSLRLFPPNTVNSDGAYKQPGNASSSSIDLNAANSSNASATSALGYQKLGSPELRPLPPLPRQNFRQSYRTAEVSSFVDDEEFFSPRGSSGGRGSPIDIGSGYWRGFQAIEAENFGSRSWNSRTASYPFSNPVSPTGSLSSNPSMPLIFSPRSLRSKSPDSVVDLPAPPPPPPASPPKGKPLSPSPLSSSPPPPPTRFWETPVVPKAIREPITGLPILAAPPRPAVFQNPVAVSPTEQSHKLETIQRNEETPKPKLKALHWDKVRTSSDRAMVWDQLKSSSFQLNEEMIETLFMVNTSNLIPKNTNKVRRPVSVLQTPNQENRVLDPKKSQNIAILLRALNVTIDEVCEALLEGNADTLGTELLESLLRMAPTKEEERKLKEFKDESPFKLGPAEKFLKAVLDIPFAFQRVEAMLYIASFDSEVEYLKSSFKTLQAACEELRNSRMFLKLLETVLKTGNHMNVGTNRGDAHAFKLDTLLKLVDVKGTDGKTTLLHFVVQEIIRAEGSHLSGANQNPTDEQFAFGDDVESRKLGLQVVSGLSGELINVKKAAVMDSDVLSSEVRKLGSGITKVREIVKLNEEHGLGESRRKFSESMNELLNKAEEEIIKVQAEENVALALVKEITEYFHGNSAKEEAHPFRIFVVVRDFLSILDRVCKEVGKINERTIVSWTRPFLQPVNPKLPQVFPGFSGRRQYSPSDDENSPSP